MVLPRGARARGLWVVEVVGIALAYYLSGRLGLSLAYVGSNVTLVWPPTGLAIALLVRRGRDRWPGVFVGAFAVNLAISSPPGLAAAIAVGNTLGPTLAAWLLVERLGFDPRLERRHDIVAFAVTVLLTMVVQPTVGVTALYLGGVLPAARMAVAWAYWWMGDTVGALVVGPLLLAATRASLAALRGRRALELAALMAFTVAIAVPVLLADGSSLAFVVLVPLVWAALRLPGLGAALVTNVVAGLAVTGTVLGRGPFAQPDLHTGLLLLTTFEATIALLSLLVGALLGEKAHAEAETGRHRELLERIAQVQREFIAAPEPRPAARRLLDSMRAVTGSAYGFFAEIHRTGDGQPFMRALAIDNLAWNDETRALYAAGEKTGFEFHNMATLFGAVVKTGAPVIANDPAHDPRRGGLPPGHPPLLAFLGLPLVLSGELVGIVGLANRPGGYDQRVIDEIEPVLATCAALLGALRSERRRHEAEAARGALEAQLRQAQKLEAIGTLAGGIAHDFNNILGAIMGNVYLLRRELQPGTSGLESLEQIDQASARARDLVRQILTFSRPQDGPRKSVDLGAVVGEVLRLMRASLPAGVHVEVEVDPACPLVRADPSQLHQVVMNLVTNAVQALPERRGRLRLTLTPRTITAGAPPGAATPRLPAGRYACLSVQDDGVGMDEATRERIFEPFFTTKRVGEGTGLGMAVVHGVVTGHGGAVEIDSAPGRGTTVRVVLPAAADPVAQADERPSRPRHGTRQRIVLVDDEPMLLRIGRRILEAAGYEVTTFDGGARALEALRGAPSACDLVITDLTMPQMSGLELARELAALRPGLPVLVVTGHGGAAALVGPERALVREVIDKPFSPTTLLGAVERALA